MNSDEIRKRLGENLKRIRKGRNFTQFELAEKAGVSEETVKNIELSRCWTSDKNLEKITSARGVDVFKLFVPVSSSLKISSEASAGLKKEIGDSVKKFVDEILEELESE
jgi:transcriptional regulator with XRE-family HTH domain